MQSLAILIIEDELITALDLKETLLEAGHRVTGMARTFEQAMQACQHQWPDLALIDIRLDGSPVDGITTARALQARGPLPIIYLTAHSEPPTFDAAKETRPAAYLLKPFRHDELKLQIELAYHHFHDRQSTPTQAPQFLYLPIANGYEKVDQQEVLYLKADGSYVWVYLLGNDRPPYYISSNIGHLATYLSADHFHRLSRSLLVNLNHIDRLERNHLYLTTHKTPIPLPTTGRKELMNKLRIVRTK